MTAHFVDYERLFPHRLMLNDRVRTEAFRLAIERAVKPGDVVVDLGAGTGVLSVFAARAGAARVYAIERTGIISAARRIAEDEGLRGIEFISDDSERVHLPEHCDVLVSECIGSFGLQENMLGDFVAFRKRWLKDDGRVIPRGVDLYVAPVESEEAFDLVSCWDRFAFDYGINFSCLRDLAANTTYNFSFDRSAVLAAEQLLARIELDREIRVTLDAGVDLVAERSGEMHGICGAFVADLGNDVSLDTTIGRSTHWEQEFFPCGKPLLVATGDRIGIHISATTSKAWTDWHWAVSLNGDERETHDPRQSVRIRRDAGQ